MKKRKILIIVLAVVLVALSPFIVWGSSLLKCEVLTNKYYNDFADAWTGNTMLDEPEYFKVLNCNGKTARVYYVSEGKDWASVLTFEKTDVEWVETNWETVWSTTGSASEVVYPYLWHFIF